MLDKIKDLLKSGQEESIKLARTLYKTQKEIQKPNAKKPTSGWTKVCQNCMDEIWNGCKIARDAVLRELERSENHDKRK